VHQAEADIFTNISWLSWVGKGLDQ